MPAGTPEQRLGVYAPQNTSTELLQCALDSNCLPDSSASRVLQRDREIADDWTLRCWDALPTGRQTPRQNIAQRPPHGKQEAQAIAVI